MSDTTNESLYVLSVGGSIISPPGGIDVDFLKKLNGFIREYVEKGKKFFLVTGGGTTCRFYQKAAKEVIGDLKAVDIDWLGIHATRLNGQLLRTIFVDIAHPRIIENYAHRLENWTESVVIGAGWKPGWSTDYDAVILARDYGARLIVNLSNTDWVYDKDPKKFPDAKKIVKTTWSEYTQIVGDTWTPGLNTPFDPIASKLAAELNLSVIITNGDDFENLRHIIDGEDYKGSLIGP